MPGPIRDEWLPSLEHLKVWFDEMVNKLKVDPPAFNSVVADFENFARRNADIYEQLNEMIDQAIDPKPKDVDQMFQLFNLAIYFAPVYNGERLVGRPVNAIIATCMQTPAGRAVFNDKEVNKHIKKMFDVWVVCLTSKMSRPVLNQKDGWLGPDSLQKLRIPRHDDKDPEHPTNPLEFTAAYACNTNDEYYGFKSWDDFFVRA